MEEYDMQLYGGGDDSDLDDGEIIPMLFTVAQHFIDQTSTNDTRTRTVLHRDREEAQERLVRDYFAADCLYDHTSFERFFFRVAKPLFLCISNTSEAGYDYFKQKSDVTGRLGFTAIQNCMAALRYLAYGITFDATDDYLKMAERTARESVDHFCTYLIEVFGKEYLHKPSRDDIEKLYAAHEARHGLPVMISSLDCKPSLILEVIASFDLWIWHAYFGVAGSNNDRIVLTQSPIFNDIWTGRAPDMSFVVNRNEYRNGYYLCDGIYRDYFTFVKAFKHPQTRRCKNFKERQEFAKKDGERAFGVLKAK